MNLWDDTDEETIDIVVNRDWVGENVWSGYSEDGVNFIIMSEPVGD